MTTVKPEPKEEPLNKLSLNKINTPTSITPFHSCGSRSSARTAAIFYTQCHLHGIPPQDADDAAVHSKKAYRDWWKQERFSSGDDKNSMVLKQLMRKKRRFREIHKLPTSDVSTEFTSYESISTCDETVQVVSEEEDNTSIPPIKNQEEIKSLLLQTLISSNGDVTTPEFQTHLSHLQPHTPTLTPSNWVSLSKPNYPECLGMNSNGEFMYTLGRMSFDMFLPSNLKCSIHGIFNVFGDVGGDMTLPWNIRKVENIRSYNISVSFSIDAPKGTLKALLTNYGYIAPDPIKPNRYSIWFTHGILSEDSSHPSQEWIDTFENQPQRSLKEKARILAAQILLGASVGGLVDGKMEYKFKRPIGGWNDMLFGDESLIIMRGQHGSMYVLHRI